MALTAEQRKKIDEAIAPLVASAMRTDPIDKDACVAAFDAAYAALNLAAPEYEFCTSPLEAFQHLQNAISSFDKFKETLGDDAYLCGVDFTTPEIRQARLNPIWSPAGMRADKRLEAFHDLYNVVKSALEKSEAQKGKALILDCGNVGLWYHVEQAGRFEAASALGVYQPPRAYVLARMALETCGWAFCFERYCFISERPESFHHPQLSKDQPRDRIIVKWRDGFVCDKELWF